MNNMNLYLLAFMCVKLVTSQSYQSQTQHYEMPQYLKTKYGQQQMSGSSSPSGVKTAKTKTHVKTISYGTSDSNMGSYAGQRGAALSNSGGSKFRGGCNNPPPSPMNSGMKCSQYSGCRADCIPNYQFPNGLTQLFITCKNGIWQIEGNEWDQVPNCEPICLPPCQNSGICYAPNQCNCPETFSGPQCQFENKPCLNYPPIPVNSRRSCRSKTCTITCATGHQFPDGSTITTMECKNGYWIPGKETWTSVPDCMATCDPPCLNGGNCLSFNTCQCPQDFRGPHCEYRSDACHARKMEFNGAYNCSGDSTSFSCSISCPEGIPFDFNPAPVYTCTYSSGTYLPQPIPQCVFPDNVQITHGGGSSHTYYHLLNNSGYDMNSLTVNGRREGDSYSQGGYHSGQHQWITKHNQVEQEKDINGENIGFVPMGKYGSSQDNIVFTEHKLPRPGVCFTWGGTHYKTFDGKVYSFNSQCAHTLVRDAMDNTFSVVVRNAKECYTNPQDCHRIIKIYYQLKEYVLTLSDKRVPILLLNKKILPMPGQFPGLRIKKVAHLIVVLLDAVGATIKWDGKQMLQVEVKESLWNRTEGLCGNIDSNQSDDMIDKAGHKPKSVSSLAVSWKVEDLEDECNDVPSEEHACTDTGIKGSKGHKAMEFCKKLLNDERLGLCKGVIDVNVVLDACRWDYCSCYRNSSECACETIDVYVRSCAQEGIKGLSKWRSNTFCPLRCTDGRVYRSCAPPGGQVLCSSTTEESDEDNCVEGCYCPEGTVLHENSCITKDQCPCYLRTKSFPPGSQIPKDCNTCTCVNGQWTCTQVSCGARCSAVGDPHYETFDGRKYDFMGQCSYYLVKTPSLSIEAENVACAGSISQAMNLPASVSLGLPSCTKAVTIRIAGQIIKLKQNHDVVVNGMDISRVPYNIANVTIRSVSSIFLQVELPNGIEVWWDGVTRVYIDIPAVFSEKTKGLCGTFNYNQKDDFLTPEDDIERAVIPFANKWKTEEACNDVPDKLKSDPCIVNIHNKPTAEKHCKTIKSDLFADCHFIVDPEPFYQNCLFDMCSCEFKVSKCLCPIVASYAAECSRKGVKIDWRNQVRECGVHCSGGQKYQVCGNPCTRTCYDVATRPECLPQCVEGCNCPNGQTLDDEGECVPISQCKCQFEGIEFHPGYKEVRPASRGQELCTCINGNWHCKPATPEEVSAFPKASDLKSFCKENMEFTTCEPVEPVTCKNMHSPEYFSASVCHPGCKCKEGFVLDSSTKKCVKPTECPCHHGGRSYRENSTVQSDCNTCLCENGKWKCTSRLCPAECSAWGDSHFTTFDGKNYDYQGQCEYALTKGSLGSQLFDIFIQNVPCGSLGTSCSKSVSIRVKSGNDDQEVVNLNKDKPLSDYTTLKHLTVRQSGLFVIVEAADLGLVVRWDGSTRVYIRLDPRWKDKVKGLCGNYNDNEADDFQSPSGGLTEISAQIFGDSWKLQSYCPEALEITNTCDEKPDRRIWALKQCGILKSALFAPCHSEVPIDHYLEKCNFDACACDQGGDCECLCTALAAYAQECNNKGVPIKWRSQKLCPMQCDERCSNYSPCVSTCPSETCDNLLVQSKLSKLCSEDTCVEGCVPKPCPPDQVYLNSSHLECVPRNICKPICLELDGVTFYEGDLIEEDACHSCYCSRGQKICKGQPCSTTLPTPTTQQRDRLVVCTSGWTQWINQDKAKAVKTKTGGMKKTDIEPLPTTLIMNNLKSGARCPTNKIVDIECRTVRTHISPKSSGLDVECSLERGLVCKSNKKGKPCKDFEIRVFCQCEDQPTTKSPEGSLCDPAQPNQEHPTDCHLFYQCVPGMNDAALVEKTCGPSMYFNPVSMVCDWPYAVEEIKPECKKHIPVTVAPDEGKEDLNIIEPEVTECPPGTVKEDCAIQCERLCLFYDHVVKQSGKCLNSGTSCESGCVSADKKMACPSEMFWANNHTCVSLHDCLCHSKDGKPVRPGTTYRESDCEVCQCVDNFYTCDKSSCEKTINENLRELKDLETTPTTELPVFISTVTPPEDCDENNFIDLIQDQPLPDDAFSASSVLSASFKPQYSKLESKVTSVSGGSWTPEYSNLDQYLEIDLGRQEPIYGIKIKGSPLYDEYVTSYKVLYSPYGDQFYPVLNKERHPQIFRGSINSVTPVKQIFNTPFEAQKIRINPQTWHNGISLRVEIIGCGEPISTTPAYEFITAFTTLKPSQCDDPMGLQNGIMSNQQISVSSELDRDHGKNDLNMSSDQPWQPLTNSPTEYVQFDFLEPRNITGFVTKGGPKGWVTALTVKYAHDDKSWNPILDSKTLKEKVFVGNFDKQTPQVNSFDLPISARFIKLVPKKWHENIQLQAEIHGCFKPYPQLKEIPTTVAPPSNCNFCTGVNAEVLELQACRCEEMKWWDGENCVNRTECPCMVGHIPYAVGTVFEKEDCSECICKLGGVAHCSPKKCENCEKGLRSTVTSTCKCTCQPCPDDTTLCPTSNICINSTLWCNGIQDCPDDEISCLTTLKPTTVVTEKPVKKCPKFSCPPGYKKLPKRATKTRVRQSYLSPMFSGDGRKATKTTYKGSYAGIKTGGVKGKEVHQRPLSRPPPIVEELICVDYRCVSEKPPPKFVHDKKECPPANCPLGYKPFFEEDNVLSNECPTYTCNPLPPPDAICNVTGRTFNTFDETEYKYDICNHILARDLENDDWSVALKKNCREVCQRVLDIHHGDHIIILHPDLTVEYNGYKYTIDQTKQIGHQANEAFSMARLGNALLFVSNHYGFWIIWDRRGNVKLGAVRKLLGKIDGLCGYFNENRDDDKRKPNGVISKTTVEFGDSWAQADEACETKACPVHVQNKAWKMCNEVKNQVLAPCSSLLDIEAFISRCLETTCECLEASKQNNTAEEACRCETLQSFVVDCLSINPSAGLSDWRMKLDCPASCEAPLVYHDCYQRKCEPTCESIFDPNVCPILPHICFPGCYCPAGFVKKGDNCIKPSNCRDCECNVLPHLQYITYDESDFTITGNCVYVMTRDKILDQNQNHKFQVLITNAPCRTNEKKSCVGKITILYKGRKIHILTDFLRNKLRMIVNGERIDQFDDLKEWAQVRETSSKHIKILLTDVQIEVSVYYPSLGVSVKAPSHKYGSKLEGLCGDCNKESDNDLRTPDGTLTKDVDEFGLSWLYDKLPGGQSKEACANIPKEECPPLPADQDPCVQLLDVNKFGQCLQVFDPSLFIEWCKKDTCGGHPELACASIEAYARDCSNSGFCINWRNDYCPAKPCESDKIYDPCGTSCPKTCESIKKGKKSCKSVPVEGCFCPEGKVLLNDTCVLEKDCEVCDQENHHPGDIWNKDKCTKCTCEGISVKCETQHCPTEKICGRGYQSIKIPTREDECCEQFTCVPEPTVGPTCETPQNLICGPGQVTKLDTKPNGCQQFICECKPPEECDPIDATTDAPLEDGYIKEIDRSGCCPELNLICKPETCPKPQQCEQYHTIKNETIFEKCCPIYTCVPPLAKCIYQTEFTAAEAGGERLRTKFEIQKLLKNANETWLDGPCRECKCARSSMGNYQAICTQVQCSAIHTSQDYLEYKLEAHPVFGQCCSEYKRIACKFDGKTYAVGEKWIEGKDYCSTVECVNSTNGVTKRTLTVSCDTNCDLGFKYIEAPAESKECCGSCKPYACVVDGTVHQVGDTWKSEDHCTSFACVRINGSLQVQSVVTVCAEVSQEIFENFAYETIPVKGECCKKHKITACKVEGKVYKIGETWPSPDGDKCKNITCLESHNGELSKQEVIETCKTDCPTGSKYKKSNTSCCGECFQIACVVNGEIKRPGENWTSSDKCTLFTCDKFGDSQYIVSSQQETCPSLDDCPPENIYEKGCCKHCNITTSRQTMCGPETIASVKTVGIIKVNRPPHGVCVNKKPIDGFTECIGTCHSSTFFNLKSGSHESDCSCCQATKYTPMEIELECEDGSTWSKKVAVPSNCGCAGCASAPTKKNTKSSYVKS